MFVFVVCLVFVAVTSCKYFANYYVYDNNKLTRNAIALGKVVEFVLSFRIDPIGEQNDVQHLSVFVKNYIFDISGTVPTYGTA